MNLSDKSNKLSDSEMPFPLVHWSLALVCFNGACLLLLLMDQVRTLFVSGLPMDAKPRELYLLFRAYDGYENSQLKVTSKNGKTTSVRARRPSFVFCWPFFCFVSFSCPSPSGYPWLICILVSLATDGLICIHLSLMTSLAWEAIRWRHCGRHQSTASWQCLESLASVASLMGTWEPAASGKPRNWPRGDDILRALIGRRRPNQGASFQVLRPPWFVPRFTFFKAIPERHFDVGDECC